MAIKHAFRVWNYTCHRESHNSLGHFSLDFLKVPYFPLLSYLIHICPPFSPNLQCIKNRVFAFVAALHDCGQVPVPLSPWELGVFPQFGSKTDTMLVALQTSWESALLYPNLSWQQQKPRSRVRLSKTSASSEIREVNEELADWHTKTGTGTTLATPQGCPLLRPPPLLSSPWPIRTSRAPFSLLGCLPCLCHQILSLLQIRLLWFCVCVFVPSAPLTLQTG